MKLAINTGYGYPDLPLKEHLRLIKKAGFDAVFPKWDPGTDLSAFAAEAREAGLEIQSIHAPFGSISRMWEAEGWQEELALQQECIRQAASIGCPLVISHVFIGFVEEHPNEIGVQAFAKLLDFAREQGIRIARKHRRGKLPGTSSQPPVGSPRRWLLLG